MFKNKLKIIFRTLWQNKVYSFISILGLAVGLSGSSLIALYIQDEYAYDQHHENKDRIYRLTTVLDFNKKMDVAVTNLAAGPTLARDYPEVVSYARFFRPASEVEIQIEDQLFKENGLWMADSTVFEVFTYPLIQGDPKEALAVPMSIVLSESLANRLFGTNKALGEQIKLNNTFHTVTGIMKDIPSHSEIQASAFVSLNTLPFQARQNFNQDWFRISFHTYLLFNQAIDPLEFKPKLVELEKKYVQPWAEANGVLAGHDYSITPLSQVHFDNSHQFDLPKGNKTYIILFASLALLLLLIAAINYVNLALAQHRKRAKEVGVRKTLGASRNALTLQFLGESFLISLIAMVLALALTELFVEPFNSISGKDVTSLDIFKPKVLLTQLGILIFISFLAGSYPALILSGLKPISVLKGGAGPTAKVGIFRKSLILFQFLFSIFMITSTLLIGNQMKFFRSMDLGFDRENLISVRLPADTAVRRQLNPWVAQLDERTGISSHSSTSLPSGNTGELMFRIEQEGEMTEQTVRFLFVDDEFLEVMGLELLEGRNFSREFQTESRTAFLVNQTAASSFGWGADALNKRVQWGLLANGQAQNDGKVVGVINDFHFLSLHNPMEPLILCYRPRGGRNVSIRLAKGDYTATLDQLREEWSALVPGHAFDFSFFDQDLEQNYQNEERMYQVFVYFAGISIVLACLGLFALLSYTIETRKKEIGIRKVMGASTAQVSWVIVRDFCPAFARSIPDFHPHQPLPLESMAGEFRLQRTDSFCKFWFFIADNSHVVSSGRGLSQLEHFQGRSYSGFKAGIVSVLRLAGLFGTISCSNLSSDVICINAHIIFGGTNNLYKHETKNEHEYHRPRCPPHCCGGIGGSLLCRRHHRNLGNSGSCHSWDLPLDLCVPILPYLSRPGSEHQ